jgi:carbonic anhydrase/acetyltransferase-like protein (isoleucine patch superfamily)
MAKNEKLGYEPYRPEHAVITEGAHVMGDVELGTDCSVWFGAVLRGDSDQIRVGDGSNVQDNAVLHADPGFPCHIGDHCIIGHGAIVHGATLKDHVLVGMNAVILNGAEIGEYCIIGANALITGNTKIPPYSLVLGSPAKVVGQLSEEQKAAVRKNAEVYIEKARAYRSYKGRT